MRLEDLEQASERSERRLRASEQLLEQLRDASAQRSFQVEASGEESG